MSHVCVHFHYKRDLLKKAAGLLKRKPGLISPLSWPVFAGKAVFNERNIHPFPIFPEECDESMPVTDAWDNKGDIVISNTILLDCEPVALAIVSNPEHFTPPVRV